MLPFEGMKTLEDKIKGMHLHFNELKRANGASHTKSLCLDTKGLNFQDMSFLFLSFDVG